jgi:hypothetical protein
MGIIAIQKRLMHEWEVGPIPQIEFQIDSRSQTSSSKSAVHVLYVRVLLRLELSIGRNIIPTRI